MQGIVQIQAPLPHIRSVNIWLLRGSPLTLIDTGPRSDEALEALEAGLSREGRSRRGHRARDPHTPPPRSFGPGRDDRRTVGSSRGCARSRRRLWRALRRSLGGRSLLLARADAPSRGARLRDRCQRRLLGLHPRHVRAVRDRRGAVRWRCDRGRRARSARAGEAGPQHDRHLVRRRAERHRVRRRSPVGRDLLQRRDRAGGGTHRIAAPGSGRVPRKSAADRVDAARAVADRSRGSGPRPCRPGPPPIRASTDAGAVASSTFSNRAPPRRTGSPATCGRREPWPSSPCWSCGRCSGISTCCWTTRSVSEQKIEDGSRYGKAWFSLPEQSPAHRDPNGGLRETSILYPGGNRSAQFD